MARRPVVGFEGLYEVSVDGAIHSVGTRVSSRQLKLTVRRRDGYVAVGLWKSKKRFSVKVHRVVAEAFIANTESLPQVDHLDGDRANNAVENLRWVTGSINGSNRTRAWAESGIVGVYASVGKANPFRSAVCIQGVKRALGVFKTAGEAQAARINALKEVGRV